MDSTTESESIVSDEQTTDYNNEIPINNTLNNIQNIYIPSPPSIFINDISELPSNSIHIPQNIELPTNIPTTNQTTYQSELNNNLNQIYNVTWNNQCPPGYSSWNQYDDWHAPTNGICNTTGWSNDIVTDSDHSFPPPEPEPTSDNYDTIPEIEQEPEPENDHSVDIANQQNLSINIPQVSETQTNNQYSMLYNEDADNPFSKCKFQPLEYDTDDETNLQQIRILYTWNYEFNYDYFTLNDVDIFITKNNIFKEKLNNIKTIRNNNNSNITGNIIKLNNNHFKKDEIINIYLIAYYDNAKVNIEFYGMFNQPLDEDKLIENIKLEGIYGKNGIFSTNFVSSIGSSDFIVLYKRCFIS